MNTRQIVSTMMGIAALTLPAISDDGATAPRAGPLDSLPLAFVENRGQWDTPARFVASRGPLAFRAEPDALVAQLSRTDEEGHRAALVTRMRFEGAREEVELVGEEPQRGLHNYYVGGAERRRAGVPAYSRVLYRGLYEGIDLRLREHAGRLEYDLLLAPEADLERFVARCEGVAALELHADGSLVMHTDVGPLRHSPPETWQVLPGGERRGVPCRFVLLDECRFGFAVEGRQSGLPLVIDPGLEWSTFLGGSDLEYAVGSLGPAGRVVLGGLTLSPDFPAASGSLSGQYDAFVAVLDPSLPGPSQLLWATYLGGSLQDKIWDLELDAAGNIFASGSTRSSDLPVSPDAYDGSHNGGFDAFVCELDSVGQLTYLTYFGGSSAEAGAELALQPPRIVTLGGTTYSSNLPVAGAYQDQRAGGLDYYFARLDLDQPPAGQLLYSTYLGGSADDGFPELVTNESAFAMDLDLLPSGELAVTGMSLSADYPTTPNAFDPLGGGGQQDGIVTFLEPSLGPLGLTYSTFLGGSLSGDGGMALETDDAGVVTVGGYTYAADFPTTPGAYDTSLLGGPGYNDAFLARLDREQQGDAQLVYSTFLGGEGYDGVLDLELDANGDVVAVGWTGYQSGPANSFPTTCGAYDETYGGVQDGFLLYLSPSGNGASDLLYSTFVGGSGGDGLWSVDLVSSGSLHAICVGNSEASDFPTVDPCQPYHGGWDAVALRLEINPHTYCVAAPNSLDPDGALICGTGSVAISDNAFTVSVSGATPGQSGVFFYGPEQVQLPFGNGLRCVGAGSIGVFRLNPPLVIDGTGTASRLVDFTQPPAGSGPGQISAGSTWFFQFWYRDPAAGGATFNLSNGLQVTFYP